MFTPSVNAGGNLWVKLAEIPTIDWKDLMGTKKSETGGAKKPARAAKAPARAKAPAKAPARAKRTTAAHRKATPTHEDIATRAYFLAEESGTSDHVHHWLTAEDELTAG